VAETEWAGAARNYQWDFVQFCEFAHLPVARPVLVSLGQGLLGEDGRVEQDGSSRELQDERHCC
jgi:hypothetical protein